MRASVGLLVVSLTVYVYAHEGYDVDYSTLNIDELTKMPRMMVAYAKCFGDVGPCTPVGRQAKKYLKEVVETNCAKCSEEQKIATQKIMKVFHANHNDGWTKLMEKYDPTHEHEKSFLKWIYEENKH